MYSLKFNLKRIKSCISIFGFITFYVLSAFGQTTIYNADFSTDNDGFPNHSNTVPPAAAPASVSGGSTLNDWTLSYTNTPGTDATDNIFKVVSGALVSDDWGGQGIFQSSVIDVSSLSLVDISAISINAGANDGLFTYFYILDGGSRVNTIIGTTTSGSPVNYSISNLDVSTVSNLIVGFEFSENGGNQGYSTSSFTVMTPSVSMCTPPQFTAIATCVDGVTDAPFDTYYISVVVEDLGSASSVDIDLPDDNNSVDDDQSGVGTGTYVFGPYTYVDGLAAQTVTVSDAADATCNSTAEVSELRCGYTPDNGNDSASGMNACGTFCSTQASATATATTPALIAQAAPGSVSQGMTNATNYVYVLVAGGNVVSVNNSGLFTSLMNGTAYTVHAFNVLETDRANFETQFVVGNAYTAPSGSECFSSCGNVTKTTNCFTCPTVSVLSVTSPICTGEATTDLEATIANFFNSENGAADYDVEFVYTTIQQTTAAGVYGLTSTIIGTEDIAAAGVTSVTEGSFTLPTVTTQTTYYVYARIFDAANVVADAMCRPFTEAAIVVNPLPVLTAQTVSVCSDATTYDLTSLEADITSETGAFTYSVGGTAVAAPTAYSASNGDVVDVNFTNTATTCMAGTTITFTVNALPVLTAQTPEFCANATNGTDLDNLDLTSYESAIGIPTPLPSTPNQATVAWYEGNGTTGTNITSMADDQDGVADGDVFTVEYTNENGCVNTTTITVTVNANPIATLNDPMICMSSTTAPLILTTTSGVPTMYAIDYIDASITDITTTSTLPAQHMLPSTLAAGAYSGTITFTDADGCFGTDDFTITVQAASDPGMNGTISVCNADPNQFSFNLFDELGGTAGTTGTWSETTAGTMSGATIGAGNTGAVSMQNVAAGTYEFTYTIAATGSCPASSSTVIVTVTNCFDLALTKVLTTTGVVKPGDNVTFDIAVVNQGMVTAFDVDIEDYFDSAELTFVSAAVSPNDAVGSSGSAAVNGYTINQIAVGATAIVQVTMTIDSAFTGNTIVNNAEIIGAASVDNGPDAIDSDSVPSTEDGTMTDPNDNDTGMADGSDDYDPATLIICQSNCGTFPWDGTN